MSQLSHFLRKPVGFGLNLQAKRESSCTKIAIYQWLKMVKLALMWIHGHKIHIKTSQSSSGVSCILTAN